MKKFIEQFEVDNDEEGQKAIESLSEDRATLLYMIDVYHKNLLEVEKRPVRRIRELLDQFARDLMNPEKLKDEKLLFEFRQFFSSYRIAEFTYIQKTFDDFKKIIWDFADQLGEDLAHEKAKDLEIKSNLDQLREAVESNSIDVLKKKSREFINFYVEHQTQKDEKRIKKIQSIKKNLGSVKKQLMEANETMRTDHLTQCYNRKSFEEQMQKYHQLFQISKSPISLVIVDIDHFKKINDTYGHDIGDFVLKECVRQLKEIFPRPEDFVARLGGEEFAILLPELSVNEVLKKCDEALQKIRKEVFVHQTAEIKYTVSLGLAVLDESESIEEWFKKADQALYTSKNSGRNRMTLATSSKVNDVA